MDCSSEDGAKKQALRFGRPAIFYGYTHNAKPSALG